MHFVSIPILIIMSKGLSRPGPGYPPEKSGKIVPSIVPFIALKNAVTGRDRQ